MTQLGAWLEDLKADRISLVALITCLNDRGPIDLARHEAELQELVRLQTSGTIDQKLYRAIRSKLLDMQGATDGGAAASAPSKAVADEDDDATRLVDPATDTPPKDPEEDFEATRLMAAPPPLNPSPQSAPAPHESTVIMSAPIKPRSSSATGDHSRPSNTSSTSSGASRSSLSSWKRLSEATAPVQDIGPGFMIKERFIVERKIGEGGMGVVFLALDERKVEARDRNPRVAVKILNDEFRQHPDALIALQRESRRSQQLAHDNIVRVYDFDKDGAMVYMTMEYVDGQDLKKLIRSVRNKGLPFDQAFPIIEGIASALYRAHSEGIVHSDFKPGNVMLTKDNTPKVFDFGIARAGKKRADGSMEQTVFDAGSLGALTPAYASLEMLEGAEIEAQDDLYALGCVVYEILAGFHPFKKVNAENAEKKGLVPQRIEGLSRKQWQTLKKCLAFRRKDRLTSALELIQGMRPKSAIENALPVVAIAGLAIAIVGGAYWLTTSIGYGKQISAIESCIESKECADATVLKNKLDTLKPEDRAQLVESHRESISTSFRAQLDQHWSPENGKYDYEKAGNVVTTAFGLYGDDSAWVTKMQSDLADDRNVQLARLNDQLSERIEPFFGDQASQTDADPMLETLDAIRMIDRDNPIFKDGWIIAAFEQAVHSSLSADALSPDARIAAAEERLATAATYLEDDDLLAPIKAEINQEKQRYAELDEGERAYAKLRARNLGLLARLATMADRKGAQAASLDAIEEAWNAAFTARAAFFDRDLYRQSSNQLAKLLLKASQAHLESGQDDQALRAIGLAFEKLPTSDSLASQFETVTSHALKKATASDSADTRTKKRNDLVRRLIDHPIANPLWSETLGVALKTEPPPEEDLMQTVASKIENRALKHWTTAIPDGSLDKLLSKTEQAIPNLSGLAASVKAQHKASLADQRERLASLTADPRFDLEWQQALDESLFALQFDQDASVQSARNRLGHLYAERALGFLERQQLARARRAALDGMGRTGQIEELNSALTSIDSALDAQARSRQERQNEFKIEAIERTVSLDAAAGDIRSAISSLKRLKRLDRDNDYAASMAVLEITDGALIAARREAEKSRFESAIAKLDLALELKADDKLEQARTEYMTQNCKISLQAELDRPGLMGRSKRSACVKHLETQDPGAYPQFEELALTATIQARSSLS